MITEFQNTYRYLADGDATIRNRIELGLHYGYISPDYGEILQELAAFNLAKVNFRRACEKLEAAFEAAVEKKEKGEARNYKDGAQP